MTFAVAPDNVSKDIEYRDQHGKEALQHFVSTRMVNNTVEFWGVQKKNKFKYFKDVGVVMQTKIKGQLVHIKQERTLLSRLLVIAKSRPEYVVKDAIGNFEFNVTLPSNFHPDGSMIMLSSKSQLVPLIMKMSAPGGASNVVQYEENVSIRVLIIDAMCLVNIVVKTPEPSSFSPNSLELFRLGDTCAEEVPELRLMLFAQKSKEGQGQLPPTLGSFVPHTARAYHMALIWKTSKEPCPQFPPPTDYIWELVDGRLKPVYCTNLSAPETLLELRKCSCKTGCTKNSCGCKKNNLKCTDMCGCGELCQNIYHESPLDVD
ncbi:hypothetical protein GQR58_020866 [Nymphon striatum]|nr:hypothetical protein GQR58_020866 [Nymphon striatum]